MIHQAKQKNQLWYVRRDNAVQGPYPEGLISRYILLGRIHKSDEVSTGDNVWVKVADMPALIPEVMQLDMDDPVSRQRLMAAKRWADERGMENRRQTSQDMHRDKRASDRRSSVVVEEAKRRNIGEDTRERRQRIKKERLLAGLIAVSIVIATGTAFYLTKPRPNISRIDCEAPSQAGVNWNNCHKEGSVLIDADLIGAMMTNMDLGNSDLHNSQLVKADLSYSNLSVSDLNGADLRAAILVGVNLRQSNLANANLENADLSYADLSGANIQGARMDGVKLDSAIWIDGRKCGIGSTGQCLSEKR